MSKTETKEAYAIYKQNVNRYFEEAEKNVTQYIQAVSNLQQEFFSPPRSRPWLRFYF